MSSIATSAPGKAVLCGEYAVLNGAAAACIALNRRVRVTVQPAKGACSSIAAPGYAERRFRFERTTAGGIEWLDSEAHDTHRLFAKVCTMVPQAARADVDVTVDSRAFFDPKTKRKVGIGSSAATATALAAALHAGDSAQDAAVLEAARDAHAEFQHGRGSGIDIATSFHGGIVRFEKGRAVGQLGWPSGLSYRFFWSGHESATSAKLARLRGTPTTADDALARCSKSAILAIEAGAAGKVMDAFADYVAALENFDRAHDIGIFTAGHDQLVAAARAQRACVYKPCGAGGGDIGLAFAQSAADLDAFAATAMELGFSALDVDIDPHGVQREVES